MTRQPFFACIEHLPLHPVGPIRQLDFEIRDIFLFLAGRCGIWLRIQRHNLVGAGPLMSWDLFGASFGSVGVVLKLADFAK